MPHSIGQILNNRYRIVKLLGQGGFGAVYRAWDLNLNKACALKENFVASPAAQKQFMQEASILANLSHPNLPRVTDHFFVGGQGQYLVMDYVGGEDLQAKLDAAGGPLPEAQVLQWILQVCDALTYLHGQQPPVIHRDLKPANIKITPDGRAMLVDFGIAKVYDPGLKTTLGARAVTPGFSPPEQYGQGTTDARSDLYSLGAMAYALLTGQQPPASVEIIAGNVPSPLPAHAIEPGISPHIGLAVEKAMQLNRLLRFTSVAEFKLALLTSDASVPNVSASIPAPPVSATLSLPPLPGLHLSDVLPPPRLTLAPPAGHPLRIDDNVVLSNVTHDNVVEE